MMMVSGQAIEHTASTAAADISSVKGSVPNKSKNEDPNAGAGTDRPNSKFDDIRQMLYKEAIKPVGSSANRSEFTLEGWNWGSGGPGGLDDADRVTPGIDNDAVWVSQARDNSKLEHFRFNFADVGASKAWGIPKTHCFKRSNIIIRLHH
eukprot:scaffold6491_cov133-Chaetoceros_neogracile.AAC.1